MPLFGIRSIRELRSVWPVYALTFSDGLTIGWSSPGSKKMADRDTPFEVSTEQLSWVVSCFDLGMLAGCVLAVLMFSYFGRRATLAVTPICYMVFVGLTSLAPAAAYVLVGRFFAGLGFTGCLAFSGMYVVEVTTPESRGPLALLCSFFHMAGNLIMFSVGPLLPFRVQSAMPLPTLVLCLAGIALCMEESPFYLARGGRDDAVLEVLSRLRPRTATVDTVKVEACAIVATVQEQKKQSTTLRKALATPGFRKAIIITVYLGGSQGLWGFTSLIGFAAIIFSAAGSPLAGNTAAVGMMVVMNLAFVVGLPVIGKLARRPMLISSLVTNSLFLACTAAFFFVKQRTAVAVGDAGDDMAPWMTWLPVIFIYGFAISHSLGSIPLPSILASELLPEHLKAAVSPCAMVLMSATSFGITASFLPISRSVGFWLPFAFFALTHLVAAVFVMFMVPETKGKTLVEVQEMLRGAGSGERKERI